MNITKLNIYKKVEDLDEQEVELLISKHEIQKEIIKVALSDEFEFIETGLLDRIKSSTSLINFATSPTFGVQGKIDIEDHKGFIKAVDRSQEDLSYNDDTLALLDIAWKIEICNKTAFEIVVEKIKDTIIKYVTDCMNYYLDFDKLQEGSDYVNIWLDQVWGKFCVVTDDSVTLISE